MAKLKLGTVEQPTDAPDRTSRASSRATRRGNYEKHGRPPARRARDRRALDGHQRRRRASRSTRGCRTSRPPDAWPPRSPLAGAVPQLAFAVLGAAPRAVRRGADAALLAARRRARAAQPIRSVLLDDAGPDRGAPARATTRRRTSGCSSCSGRVKDWGTTLRTLLWTRHDAVVPPFTGATVVELPCRAPTTSRCSASRYFDALADGEVPLEFLFSGTVFYAGAGGQLQAARISWEQEAEYRLPVRVWRETMEQHFPRRGLAAAAQASSFDRLCAYKARHALASWEDDRRRAAARRPEPWTPSARSPTPCSTRATCCGPTAARRSRTSAAGRSAASTRAAHSARHPDDRWTMRTECLLEGGRRARVDVRVRFLHVVARQVLRDGDAGRRAASAGGVRHLSWDEAVEREIARRRARAARAIAIPAGRAEEPLAGGAIVRTWEALDGHASTCAPSRSPTASRGSRVEIANTTPWDGGDREEALRRTFCSTHTVLRTRGGAFVSQTDPPERAARRRGGVPQRAAPWPVLVDERHTRARLADHPRGPPADRAREPRRPVRRRRDRPAAGPEHPQPDRRREGRDARLRPARAGDPRAHRGAHARASSCALHGAIREFGMAR